VAHQWGGVTEPKDGHAFRLGDFVLVQEAAPTNPAAPQIWGPREVTADFEAAGANLLSLGAGLAGWDATKEYVVLCADFPDCTADQRTRNACQASEVTGLLSGQLPHRYG